LGLSGKQRRDVEAGHARANRSPDATIFLGGIRLHVIEIYMAGAAVEPEHDYGRIVPSTTWLLAGLQKSRQPDTRHPCDPQRQKAAPADAVAVLARGAQVELKHGVLPKNDRSAGPGSPVGTRRFTPSYLSGPLGSSESRQSSSPL